MDAYDCDMEPFLPGFKLTITKSPDLIHLRDVCGEAPEDHPGP